MKYIKKYENTIYSVGSYLKLTEESKLKIPIYKVVKILDISFLDEWYILEIIGNDKIWTNKHINMYSDVIERLATPEEIDQYETLKSAIKYNL